MAIKTNVKKILFTVTVILLVMFLVTCDALESLFQPPETEGTEVEYTDVEYVADENGVIKEVTLYLDGVGVPVTKSMRAINRELAMMAFDYFEVVFVGSALANVARTEWELGQPAGIADVDRGTAGINYGHQAAPVTLAPAAARGYASMFVGKKDGKTLLGMGWLTWANGNDGAPANVTTITGSTSKVTFTVGAITTGLTVFGETVPTSTGPSYSTFISTGNAQGVWASSFGFLTGGTDLGGTGTDVVATYTAFSATNSDRKEISAGIRYPVYTFPENKTTADQRQFATYRFGHINDTNTVTADARSMWSYARIINVTNDAAFGTDAPAVLKRVPRYMEGGRYREPKDRWTTTNGINFRSATGTAITTAADNLTRFPNNALMSASGDPIPLIFTLKPGQSGVFSFFIQIPVYNLTTAVNSSQHNPGGTAAGKWYIRTGVGSELYSLDDGIANGGCVFISVGASGANWIDIEWIWAP
jgi:hypothetical protein